MLAEDSIADSSPAANSRTSLRTGKVNINVTTTPDTVVHSDDSLNSINVDKSYDSHPWAFSNYYDKLGKFKYNVY
jgi:hypothetical protein